MLDPLQFDGDLIANAQDFLDRFMRFSVMRVSFNPIEFILPLFS